MSAARVALGMVELHLPDVDSLKGKRHVLKGLKERVRARFEVSVAEVDHQDMWQRAKELYLLFDNVAGRVLHRSVFIL